MCPSPPRGAGLASGLPAGEVYGTGQVSVMGVDPGLARTGWAIVSGDAFQRLTYRAGGTIKTLPGTPFPERIGAIADTLEEKVRLFGVTGISVEDHFSRRNAPGVAHLLGPVIGAVALIAHRHQLSFLSISPRELKHRVTGTGAASKDALIRSLSFWFGPGLEIGTTHEGDALGLAFLGFGRMNRP